MILMLVVSSEASQELNSLCCTSNGTPTSNAPASCARPIAAAPPVVAKNIASFQLMDKSPACLSLLAIILDPSRILETATACLMAFMISTLYPPAISVPKPTLTPVFRASRRGNGKAEKYALDKGQWAIAVPCRATTVSDGGSRNVQCA